MRIGIFGTKSYDRHFFEAANKAFGHDLVFFETRLNAATVSLADGFAAVCIFVNDELDAPTLAALAQGGTSFIALRCAGYNNVDLRAAHKLALTILRVPSYSPHAVAEFTVGLMLTLERNIHRAWSRVRENNFALDGLIGRNLHGRSVGVVGTGRIGKLVARSLSLGFGCSVLASDPFPDAELKAIAVEYVPLEDLLRSVDILTLHCPLTPATHHIINHEVIDSARDGLVIVNTSRGALINTKAMIGGLKSRKIGGVALDVYEQEGDLFFEDLSNEIVDDDVFQRLLTFPNVIVTGHQAFLTQEALTSIATTTLQGLADAEAGPPLAYRITKEAFASTDA